jgi:hypothetical protein
VSRRSSANPASAGDRIWWAQTSTSRKSTRAYSQSNSRTSPAGRGVAAGLEGRPHQQDHELEGRVGDVHPRRRIADARVEDGAHPGQPLLLDEPPAGQQAVVQVDVHQSAGVVVEPEPVEDTGERQPGGGLKAPEPQGEQHGVDVRRALGVDEQVEIRLAGQPREQVLVALPVAMADAGGVERGEQAQRDGEGRR